jgi:hypothetical protein
VVAEQLIDHGYRALIIDPEGEQGGLAGDSGVTTIKVLEPHDVALAIDRLTDGLTVVLDLSGTADPARTQLLAQLTGPVLALRAATGFPHWILIDEAHELAGPEGVLRSLFDPTAGSHCLVTYHPEKLSAEILTSVDVVVSASPPIDQILGTYDVPASGLPRAVSGQALLLRTDRSDPPRPFAVASRTTKHQRHQHKYSVMALPNGRGFRFRPGHGQSLPEARTVEQFRSQIEMVHPDTLGWHLQRGDVSRWLGDVVQDRQLAAHVAGLERDLVLRQEAEVQRAKDHLAAAIDSRYLI